MTNLLENIVKAIILMCVFTGLVVVMIVVIGYASGYYQTIEVIEVSPTTKCAVVNNGANASIDCWQEGALYD